MPGSVYRILVIGPSWVGDMVMAQSLFRLLGQRHKHCEIDVVAPAWSKPLLARMPEIHKAIVMPFGHGVFQPRARLAMGRELGRRQYDQAIVLPYSWKSGLLPFGAKIPRRTGHIGELRFGLLNDLRKLNRKKYPLMVQHYAALGLDKGSELTDYPRPQLHTEKHLQQAVMRKFGLERNGHTVVAYCPGAEYGPAKRWPAENFARLAQALLQQGRQIWLLGSEKDKAQADEINRLTQERCINLCGKTSLEDAIDLLAAADVVVCNDSGLMHIAAAVGRPLVAIYGSSDPSFTPPLSDKVQICKSNIECSPCFKRECPYGHYRCLTEISADAVSRSIDTALTMES